MTSRAESHVLIDAGFSLRLNRRRVALCLSLAGLLALATVLALATGSSDAGLAEVLAYFAGPDSQTGAISVIGDLRLPRVMLALMTGAMLGLAGASLQTLTRNGLADPGLLGVREGASLAVIGLMLAYPQAPQALHPLVGIVGGVAATVITVGISRSLSGIRFILVGIGVSWLLSALIALILTAADINRVQAAMVWIVGSLANTSQESLLLPLAFLAVGAGLLVVTARAAEVAQLGDTTALALGVPLSRLSIARTLAPVLLTAAAVSCAGSLGFVGLVAPHLSRMLIGGGQAALLAGSAVLGAGLVLVADTLGRTLFAPLQIPAGIMLAIIGVPVLLALLWRRRHQL